MDILRDDLIIPAWPELPAHITAFSTTRRGGVSLGAYSDVAGQGGLNLGDHVGDQPHAVIENRKRLSAHFSSDVIFLSQVHGIIVAEAELLQPGMQADAVIASTKGQVCAVMTADCLPVLFCDQAGAVVAAAHAGWRGLAGGILERTVVAMRQKGAGDISAWLGPAIGPRAFEVGQEVVDTFTFKNDHAIHCFTEISHGPTGRKYVADIYALARLELACSGVKQVAGGQWCTVEDAGHFYSYRRDGVTGRMGSFISIV
ncbi:peptidoglycan editing factor PgeF [Undibacterium rugosum]|uniref:Purine nucleoside phosphorylase n=1 Tax=Undibacterium rugosum TaxID=2762291 RepID=A0A923L0H9_9BURK|nr:peptidoglycan editing factor PgeF [Undibacterium rugosum]MBC3936891.1 peptidoglycan editing factor PgeF [Undibacterium rugosum]MBR7780093.1 peptidoglycan editing factor PgeF [Undibacterium rugosum]